MNVITENETILSILKYGKAMNKESIGFPEGVIKGDKKGYESVRCNNKYRLLFQHYVSDDKKEVIKITTIDLIKISNHYGDL